MKASDRPVLVLGATGMLGHRLIQVLDRSYEVHATARRVDAARQWQLPAELHSLDAGAPERLAEILETTSAGTVVNAVGLVKQLEEASRPASAIRANSLFPHVVAEACTAAGARLIHVSTDCVFSGTLPFPGRYTEEDVPDARDLYGLSKLLGEPAAPALTLRTSIVGWELERSSGLLEWVAAQSSSEVRGFTRAFFSGLTTTALAECIAELIACHPQLTGLYHVAAEPISKYDLLLRFRDVFGLDVQVTPSDEVTVNRTLDPSQFMAATGARELTWDEMLYDYERPAA